MCGDRVAVVFSVGVGVGMQVYLVALEDNCELGHFPNLEMSIIPRIGETICLDFDSYTKEQQEEMCEYDHFIVSSITYVLKSNKIDYIYMEAVNDGI